MAVEILAAFVACFVGAGLLVSFCVDTETLVIIVGVIFAVCICNLVVVFGVVAFIDAVCVVAAADDDVVFMGFPFVVVVAVASCGFSVNCAIVVGAANATSDFVDSFGIGLISGDRL